MSDRSATLDQVTPVFNALLKSTVEIVGGFAQQEGNEQLARATREATRQRVADQKVLNRILRSSVRAKGVQNTGDAPLDILMQIAGQGEVAINRIKQQGALSAAFYRNQGDQALYATAARATATLGAGLAESLGRGFLSKTGSTTIPPGRFGVKLPAPGSSGSTTLPATGGPAAASLTLVA
jgi:hypothetical protein